jgi:hypothetical protein
MIRSRAVCHASCFDFDCPFALPFGFSLPFAAVCGTSLDKVISSDGCILEVLDANLSLKCDGDDND